MRGRSVKAGRSVGEAVAALLAAGRGVGVNLPTPAPAAGCGEAEFQRAVIAEARRLGYRVAHFRKVRVSRGKTTYWETPVAADGKGFPDLVLAKSTPAGPRVIFAELKADAGRLSPEQEEWVRDTGAVVWRAADWPAIVATLKGEG